MKVKELQWQEGYIWPSEWAIRLKGTESGEEWILTEVTLHKDQAPPNIYIEAKSSGNSQGGVIILENVGHLEILYNLLNNNIGKKLTEIGDMNITL